jgi:hypothetical protein
VKIGHWDCLDGQNGNWEIAEMANSQHGYTEKEAGCQECPDDCLYHTAMKRGCCDHAEAGSLVHAEKLAGYLHYSVKLPGYLHYVEVKGEYYPDNAESKA